MEFFPLALIPIGYGAEVSGDTTVNITFLTTLLVHKIPSIEGYWLVRTNIKNLFNFAVSLMVYYRKRFPIPATILAYILLGLIKLRSLIDWNNIKKVLGKTLFRKKGP